MSIVLTQRVPAADPLPGSLKEEGLLDLSLTAQERQRSRPPLRHRFRGSGVSAIAPWHNLRGWRSPP